MTRQKANPALVSAVVLATFFSGCGNGGNSGTSVSGSNPFVDAVATASNGVSSVSIYNTPSCLATLPLNSTITIKFNKPVDPASLPNFATGFVGPAEGSIRIIDNLGVPAQGAFAVDDDPDPLLPAGNNRWVRFTPNQPSNPSAACQAGLLPAQLYTLTIPQGPNNPVLVVGGTPLEFAVTACFSTCTCVNGASTPPCGAFAFTDPVPGAPFVVGNGIFPATATSAPGPTVNPVNITANTIRILVSESLNPAGVSPASVVVKNANTGAQLPGTVVFFQTGAFLPSQAPPGAPVDLSVHALIEYRASAPLLRGVTYELSFPGGITDFGGNPLPTGTSYFFTTVAATPCAQTPIVEEYQPTSTNIVSVTGAFTLQPGPTNNGIAQSTMPADVVGDGSEGPITVTASATPTAFDTNQTITVGGSPVSRQGKWNYSSFVVNAGATARFHGPFFAHVRSTGVITVNGTVNANAGTTNPVSFPAPLAYEVGPRGGATDNGATQVPANPTVLGGKGNAGGGDGGAASHLDVDGSPSNYCPTRTGVRTWFGQAGFGPSVGGTPNSSTISPYFAGGQGGRSGAWPGFAAIFIPNEFGGFGGAGGSSATKGEDGIPRTSGATCPPLTALPACTLPQVISIAAAVNVPALFVPPISTQSAGSGGGGGGEKFDPGVSPGVDDQGGGGGGGGGGVRLSGVGAISFGTAAIVTANGAQGAQGAAFCGHGGSGSGGQIWIQTFDTITTNTTSAFRVEGPPRTGVGTTPPTTGVPCSYQSSGGGGQGLIQLEAGIGTPSTNFSITPGAVVQTAPFPFASQVTGEVLTGFFDTGYGNPDYGVPTQVVNAGNAPSAVLTIAYEGAFETVTGGTPDLTTLKTTVGGVTGGAKITAANVATELDGYRFIRIRASVVFPPPPGTPLSAILPSIDSVSIPFMIDCP